MLCVLPVWLDLLGAAFDAARPENAACELGAASIV